MVKRVTSKYSRKIKRFIPTKRSHFCMIFTVLAIATIGTLTLIFSHAQSLYSVPDSIASDCSKPAQQELIAFLKTVPDGSTIQFPSNACYGEDAQFEVNDRNNLTFEGNGTTFKTLVKNSQCQANFRISGGSNIIVKNMVARGTFPTTGYDDNRSLDQSTQCSHGFSFDSVQGGKILNSKAYDVWGDPVSVEPDTRNKAASSYCQRDGLEPSRNILIDGFYGQNAGRTVGITNAIGVTVQNSTFNDMWDAGADLEADDSCEWMKDIHFINNHFGRHHYAMINVYTNIVEPDHMDTIEIRGNVSDVDPTGCYAPFYLSSSPLFPPRYINVIITGNDVRTIGHGVYGQDIGNNSRIENNTFRANGGTTCTDPNRPEHAATWAANLIGAKNVNVYGNSIINGPNGGFASELHSDPTSVGVTQNSNGNTVPPAPPNPTPTPTPTPTPPPPSPVPPTPPPSSPPPTSTPPSSPAPTSPPPSNFSPSDINHDNKIDFNDAILLIRKWGSSDSTTDINKDGRIDFSDAILLIRSWTK